MEANSYRRRAIKFRPRALMTVLACGIVGGLVGLFCARDVPHEFRVIAKLALSAGREHSVDAGIAFSGAGKLAVQPALLPELTDELALMQSPAVLRETVESLARDIPGFRERTRAAARGPFGGLSAMASSICRALDLAPVLLPEEQDVVAWAERLTIEPVLTMGAAEIQCSVEDVELGKAFLDRLLSVYMDAHMRSYTQARTAAVIEAETGHLRARVREAEADLTRFRVETGVVDIGMARARLLEQAREAATRHRNLAVQVAAAAAAVAEIERRIHEVPEQSLNSTTTKIDAGWSHLQRRLVMAEKDRRQAAGRYPETSALVNRPRHWEERVRELVAEQPEMREEATVVVDRDPLHVELMQRRLEQAAELQALQARRDAVAAALRQVHDELGALEALGAEHRELSSRLVEAKKDLEMAFDGARVARMNTVLDEAGVVNVSVVAAPYASHQPERVMGQSVRIAMVYGGVALGMLLAGAFHMLRSAIADEQAIVRPPSRRP